LTGICYLLELITPGIEFSAAILPTKLQAYMATHLFDPFADRAAYRSQASVLSKCRENNDFYLPL
jgi:hypothetical protein